MNCSSVFCKISFWCFLMLTFLHVQLFCILQVCPFDFSWCWHYLIWYFIPSWIVLLCRARSPFDVAYCWHCSQGIFIPSWTVHLCCARSPSWTSLLSNQDFLLLLLDTDIVHMDISFLHELFLYVVQDLLLMSCSSVFCKTSFWCCFKLTLSTMILYSFMNCSFMPFKNSLCCCLILTLSTWICHTFMSWKISFWCLLMLKLSQGYIMFSWTALLCLTRCPFDVSWCWHCLQWYFISLLTARLCHTRSPFHIAQC